MNFYSLRASGHFYKLLILISIKIILLNLNEYIPPINIHAVSLKGSKMFPVTYPNDKRRPGAGKTQTGCKH